MTKFTRCLMLLGILTLTSCSNTPSTPQSAETVKGETSTKSSAPDPNDLLQTLQGRWQSEQDASYTLEFADTQMRHFTNGQLTHQSNIDVDGACESPVCKPDGVDTSDGWCFIEMSVEGGKYKAQCNFVTLCDPAKLQYRSLSGAGSERYFKKIQ